MNSTLLTPDKKQTAIVYTEPSKSKTMEIPTIEASQIIPTLDLHQDGHPIQGGAGNSNDFSETLQATSPGHLKAPAQGNQVVGANSAQKSSNFVKTFLKSSAIVVLPATAILFGLSLLREGLDQRSEGIPSQAIDSSSDVIVQTDLPKMSGHEREFAMKPHPSPTDEIQHGDYDDIQEQSGLTSEPQDTLPEIEPTPTAERPYNDNGKTEMPFEVTEPPTEPTTPSDTADIPNSDWPASPASDTVETFRLPQRNDSQSPIDENNEALVIEPDTSSADRIAPNPASMDPAEKITSPVLPYHGSPTDHENTKGVQTADQGADQVMLDFGQEPALSGEPVPTPPSEPSTTPSDIAGIRNSGASSASDTEETDFPWPGRNDTQSPISNEEEDDGGLAVTSPDTSSATVSSPELTGGDPTDNIFSPAFFYSDPPTIIESTNGAQTGHEGAEQAMPEYFGQEHPSSGELVPAPLSSVGSLDSGDDLQGRKVEPVHPPEWRGPSHPDMLRRYSSHLKVGLGAKSQEPISHLLFSSKFGLLRAEGKAVREAVVNRDAEVD